MSSPTSCSAAGRAACPLYPQRPVYGLQAMSDSTRTPTTLSNIGVAMFAVADQDAALAFYTEKLGFEVRGDTRFGEHHEMRWLEVAPPASRARLALNPPMGGEPGGGSIGVVDGGRPGRARAPERHRRHRPRTGADAHARGPAHVHAARPGRQPRRRGGGAARLVARPRPQTHHRADLVTASCVPAARSPARRWVTKTKPVLGAAGLRQTWSHADHNPPARRR